MPVPANIIPLLLSVNSTLCSEWGSLSNICTRSPTTIPNTTAQAKLKMKGALLAIPTAPAKGLITTARQSNQPRIMQSTPTTLTTHELTPIILFRRDCQEWLSSFGKSKHRKGVETQHKRAPNPLSANNRELALRRGCFTVTVFSWQWLRMAEAVRPITPPKQNTEIVPPKSIAYSVAICAFIWQKKGPATPMMTAQKIPVRPQRELNTTTRERAHLILLMKVLLRVEVERTEWFVRQQCRALFHPRERVELVGLTMSQKARQRGCTCMDRAVISRQNPIVLHILLLPGMLLSPTPD